MEFLETSTSRLSLREKTMIRGSLIALAGSGSLIFCLMCGLLTRIIPNTTTTCDPGNSFMISDPIYGALIYNKLDNDTIYAAAATMGDPLYLPIGVASLTFNPDENLGDSTYSFFFNPTWGPAEWVDGPPIGQQFQDAAEECLNE